MCALLFSFGFLGANLSPPPLRATARALRAPFLPTEPALFPIFSRVRFWESASQASVERERRAKSREVSEEQFAPLSCRRKKRFRRKKKKRRRRQQTKKLNLISPLLLPNKTPQRPGRHWQPRGPLGPGQCLSGREGEGPRGKEGQQRERGEKAKREAFVLRALRRFFFVLFAEKSKRERQGRRQFGEKARQGKGRCCSTAPCSSFFSFSYRIRGSLCPQLGRREEAERSGEQGRGAWKGSSPFNLAVGGTLVPLPESLSTAIASSFELSCLRPSPGSRELWRVLAQELK